MRTLTSANIRTDHNLVLGKIRLTIQLKKTPKPEYVDKFNIESLDSDSTKDLYSRRLSQKIKREFIRPEDQVEEGWNKIKTNIENAANEAIGTRKVNIHANPTSKTWFTTEVKELAKEKRKAYIKT